MNSLRDSDIVLGTALRHSTQRKPVNYEMERRSRLGQFRQANAESSISVLPGPADRITRSKGFQRFSSSLSSFSISRLFGSRVGSFLRTSMRSSKLKIMEDEDGEDERGVSAFSMSVCSSAGYVRAPRPLGPRNDQRCSQRETTVAVGKAPETGMVHTCSESTLVFTSDVLPECTEDAHRVLMEQINRLKAERDVAKKQLRLLTSVSLEDSSDIPQALKSLRVLIDAALHDFKVGKEKNLFGFSEALQTANEVLGKIEVLRKNQLSCALEPPSPPHPLAQNSEPLSSQLMGQIMCSDSGPVCGSRDVLDSVMDVDELNIEPTKVHSNSAAAECGLSSTASEVAHLATTVESANSSTLQYPVPPPRSTRIFKTLSQTIGLRVSLDPDTPPRTRSPSPSEAIKSRFGFRDYFTNQVHPTELSDLSAGRSSPAQPSEPVAPSTGCDDIDVTSVPCALGAQGSGMSVGEAVDAIETMAKKLRESRSCYPPPKTGCKQQTKARGHVSGLAAVPEESEA
ncbi:uncharacterized protein BJ171DRAFT_595867 [Polychytrium aggregatum]|uniref:uncharacterized protein n=1 Tax=Polychytrium aggregatum TaxID=110093 RepID=UPI0022FE029D|nr:uncharacterized protein BJ171DRAFT_595867 [Polychytrium aggregatum]KAI9208779.1 hypothetical protein BJ171DRAFT_595867 [Polychytrium aggregatum]